MPLDTDGAAIRRQTCGPRSVCGGSRSRFLALLGMEERKTRDGKARARAWDSGLEEAS